MCFTESTATDKAKTMHVTTMDSMKEIGISSTMVETARAEEKRALNVVAAGM